MSRTGTKNGAYDGVDRCEDDGWASRCAYGSGADVEHDRDDGRRRMTGIGDMLSRDGRGTKVEGDRAELVGVGGEGGGEEGGKAVELNIRLLPVFPADNVHSTVTRLVSSLLAVLIVVETQSVRPPCLTILGTCPITRRCSTRSRSSGTTQKGTSPKIATFLARVDR